MIIAIIGGREFDDYQLLKKTLEPYKSKITDIVSGGARGADKLGDKWSRQFLNKKAIEFLAEWDNLDDPCLIKRNDKGELYNSLAGFKRNKDIVKKCDALIAFWDGKSTGTKDSLDYAKKIKKPVKIVYY